MIVGADTRVGEAVIEAAHRPDREVRAFVSDPETAARLRARGVKVAQGDVTDTSHVAAACAGCFTVVLVGEAALDGRERSFAGSFDEVLAAWAEAVVEAGVDRVIWVTAEQVAGVVWVGSQADPETIAAEVLAIDDRASL